MIHRVLAAATALSFTATVATAVINPGAHPASDTALTIPVKEPDKQFLPKKSPITKKAPPIVFKKVPPKIGTTPKGPIVVLPKKTPPLVKGLPPPKFIPKGPKPPVFVMPYKKKKHHGKIFAGVVLGSILAASTYYAYASPPADNLCWYWTSSSKTRGYWDYCDPPDEDDDD